MNSSIATDVAVGNEAFGMLASPTQVGSGAGAATAGGVNPRMAASRIGVDYQPRVPGSPLNGPTTSEVIQPP